LNLRKYTSL